MADSEIPVSDFDCLAWIGAGDGDRTRDVQLGNSIYTLQIKDLRDLTSYSPVYPRKKVQLTQPIRNQKNGDSLSVLQDFPVSQSALKVQMEV